MLVKFDLPDFTPDEAVQIARENYGLTASARPFPSERDQNFHLRTDDRQEYVLKIANVSEQETILDLQNRAMDYLAEQLPTLRLSQVCRGKAGESTITITGSKGTTHFVRLLTFVPGKTLAEVTPHTPKLLHSLGLALGQIDRALLGFRHPAAHRELKWDISRVSWIREYAPYVQDLRRREFLERFLADFENSILPVLPALRTSVIYNDANDYNVIVDSQNKVIGVIDFGDMVHTQTVCELAVGAAYAMLHKPDPRAALASVAAGYRQALPLTDPELEVLLPLICARLCITVTNAAYQRAVEPGNEYLAISEAPAWQLLERLIS